MRKGLSVMLLAVLILFMFIISVNAIEQEQDSRVFIKLKENADIGLEQEAILYSSEEFIVANLDESSLKELESNEGVEKIERETFYNLFLQDSVPLINASAIHSVKLDGINLTGESQTICIIDSGASYTHQGLGGCFGAGCKVISGFDFCADDSSCLTRDSNPEDVNGHGTHVAGIAAGNSVMRGVAPSANIVALKVCNATGSCPTSAIASAIEWCIGNSSIYNISVISMSLGAGLYTNYCDSSSQLTSAVDSAFKANISVIAASGNDGDFTAIADPACIQNVSVVGSSNKNDAISSFSNRNALVKLFAPGESINSSYLSASGYAFSSGTSMAAPHVAGAFAIIQEMIKSMGQTRTPKEIENAFNNTGKLIYDANSSLYYSRIDVRKAAIYLDNEITSISLISPANGSTGSEKNYTFSCNTTDISLRNITLEIWNSTGLYNSTIFDVSGYESRVEVNLSDMPIESYSWNCIVEDENKNRGYSTNYSLFIRDIFVSLDSPKNNLFTNSAGNFECSGNSSTQLVNSTLFIWSSNSMIYNQTKSVSGNSNKTSFSYNFQTDGSYSWTCLFTDDANFYTINSINYTLTFDNTKPSVSISKPLNESISNSGIFEVILNENGKAWYSLNNGGSNISMSSSNNRDFSSTNTGLAENSYNVTFYFNDTAGNSNKSNQISFKLDLTKPEVDLIEPDDNDEFVEDSDVNFTYEVSDNYNISSCKLIVEDSVKETENEVNKTPEENIFSYEFSSTGDYEWQVNCTDVAGNSEESGIRTVKIKSSSSSNSNNGGSGNSGSGGSGSGNSGSGSSSGNSGITGNAIVGSNSDDENEDQNSSGNSTDRKFSLPITGEAIKDIGTYGSPIVLLIVLGVLGYFLWKAKIKNKGKKVKIRDK
ncbi:MAG: S8 family serine peptidase [Nanoarchaeota archaeon]